MTKKDIEELSKKVDKLSLDPFLRTMFKTIQNLSITKKIKEKCKTKQQFLSINAFEVSRLIERLKKEFQLGVKDYLEVSAYKDGTEPPSVKEGKL